MANIEVQGTTETYAGGGKVHLEYGVHEFSVLGMSTSGSVDRFIKGDLSAHYWNEEVLKRVSGYKPAFICSDTMHDIYDNVLSPTDLGPAWFTLPGSPREVSGKDYLYSVAADYFGARIGDEGRFFRDSAVSYAKEDLGTFAVGIAAVVAAKVIGDKIATENNDNISRRELFRKAGKYGAIGTGAMLGSLPLVRWLSAYSAGETGNRFMHDMWSKIADITRHRLSSSVWVDGRSALIIAKALDAPNHLPEGDREGAVILGFPHAFQGQKLMESETYRAEKIRDFIRSVSETVRYLDGETLTDEELRDSAVDYFSRTAILKIKEPFGPTNYLSELITMHARYRTPEVVRALADLKF